MICRKTCAFLLAIFAVATPLATAQSNVCATELASSNNLPLGTTSINVAGLTAAGGGGTCSGTAPDFWYRFVAPSTGALSVEFAPDASATWLVSLGAFSNCATSGSAHQIACTTTNTLSSVSVVSGTPYLIRVARRSGTGTLGTLTLAIVSPPANDQCSGATPVTAGVTAVDITSALTDGPASTCGNPSTTVIRPGTNDVFYRYVATLTGTVRADTLASSPGSFGAILNVYDACGGTLLACNDDVSPGGTPVPRFARVSFSVISGEDYIIRVARESATGSNSNVLTINEYATPPANDTCATAAPVAEGSFAWDNTGAIASGPLCTDPQLFAFGAEADIWFAYTATVSGVALVDTTGTGTSTLIGVFSSCATTPSQCVQSTIGPAVFQVTTGQTYYMRVSTGNGEYTSSGMLNITVVPALPNDDCSGALTLAGGTHPINSAISTVSTDPVPTCTTLAAKDLWYRFVPTLSGNARFYTCPDTVSTPMSGGTTLSIFSSCGSTQLACSNGVDPLCASNPFGDAYSDITLAVTAGTPYTIRLMNNQVGNGLLTIVPPVCRADFNSTDGLTVNDIFDFLNAWFASSPTANFNGLNGVDVQDIFDFLNAWFAGC